MNTIQGFQLLCFTWNILGHKDNKIMKSKTNPDVERFNRWAASYDKSFMQKLLFGPVQSQMLDLLIREGPKDPPGCIIDIGCGTGRLLRARSEEHTSELQSLRHLVCRLLLEKK